LFVGAVQTDFLANPMPKTKEPPLSTAERETMISALQKNPNLKGVDVVSDQNFPG
jgi:hypothetical protein